MNKKMKLTTRMKLKFYSISRKFLGRLIGRLQYVWLIAVSEENDILDGWKK